LPAGGFAPARGFVPVDAIASPPELAVPIVTPESRAAPGRGVPHRVDMPPTSLLGDATDTWETRTSLFGDPER
jgi:hypothetical protein